MAPPVFASVFAYTPAKLHGTKWADAEAFMLANPDHPSTWPGFHALGQLRRVSQEVEAMIDGSTLITKARSRAAGAFLRSTADVWFSFDDDVDVDASVLQRMLACARATRGMVALPYVGRDGQSVCFEFSLLSADRVIPCGEDNLYTCEGGVGFGCVAVHRAAVEVLAARAPEVRSQVARPIAFPYPALFIEQVIDGEWIGEDFHFCRLCHAADIPVHLLLDAPCTHAGRRAFLSAGLELQVGDEATREALLRARYTSASPAPERRE